MGVGFAVLLPPGHGAQANLGNVQFSAGKCSELHGKPQSPKNLGRVPQKIDSDVPLILIRVRCFTWGMVATPALSSLHPNYIQPSVDLDLQTVA